MTTRTLQQNKCIHWLARRWAEELDSLGLDMREVIKVPIKPTAENVKQEIIIGTISRAYPELMREDGTFHTSDLSTTQVDAIYEAINRGMGNLCVYVPFPSEETLSEQQR